MLELKNIFVEAEGKKIVTDVSFAVENGEVTVLMGPNGSGKSSLVNALMGHPNYTITSGELLLDGVDITELSTEKKAQKGLFLSMQHIPKIGGITLATFLHKSFVSVHNSDVSVLEFYMNLRNTADQYGINPALLDRPISNGLSGGEKKLSEVLQLTTLKPAFAILDEIDSGVDVDALRIVFKAIDTLKKEGTGFLVISHHPSLLTHLSPKIVHVMSQGLLVSSGGKELAEDVLKNGFCNIVKCERVKDCSGKCD